MRRLYRWIGLSLLVGAVAAPLPAGAEPLTLPEALVMGLQHNFDLRAERLEVTRADAGVMGEQGRFDLVAEIAGGKSEAELLTASALYPGETLETETVSGEIALSKQFDIGLQSRLSLQGERTEGGGGDLLSDQLDPVYRANLVLDLTQPLLKDFGWDANLADLEVAQTRRRQAALGYLGRAEQLVNELERAYLELFQADQEYRYYSLARDLALELQRGNERKFEAGLIPVSELNEARAAVAGREEMMLLARQRLTVARNGLRDLLEHGEARLPEGEWQLELPRNDQDGAPSLENALRTGFKQRPSLQQARLETEARKIVLAYAGNQRWPRLDLEGSFALNGLAGEDGGSGSVYAGSWSDAFDGALDRDGSQWYAGLRMSVPLQNRTARARYKAAEAEDRQALYRLQRAEVAVESSIRSAHANLALGKKRLEVAGHYAVLAETTLEQENRRLREGFSDTFRVLTFQNSLIEARIREVAARTDYHRALNNLYLAMGSNLERYDIVAALPREGEVP